MKAIGVLGGTIDPPHNAHYEIAERAIEQYNLEKVVFIPSGTPWQKDTTTSFEDRYKMTNLLNQENNEEELKVFEDSNPKKETEIKEPEMFEESNLEEDFEIPAFLRRQKN